MLDAELEKIETGETSAKEARPIIASLLENGSEKSRRHLYATLGAWLWKALESGRRDSELREWFDIFRRVGAWPTIVDTPYAERFRAFYDLLDMSIATSKVVDPTEILQRKHVVSILELLREAGARPVEKAVIARKLKLEAANLSRVLHMMANARLVERTSYGKHAHFCITREGGEALAKNEQSLKRKVRSYEQPALAHPVGTQLTRLRLNKVARPAQFVDQVVAAAEDLRSHAYDLNPVARRRSADTLRRAAAALLDDDPHQAGHRVVKVNKKLPHRGLRNIPYVRIKKPDVQSGHLPMAHRPKIAAYKLGAAKRREESNRVE